MANQPLDTTLVDDAIRFAVDAHAGTERRGKGFPYVIHVLEAMAIVATMTNDPELLAAAALHDTIEDTDVTAEELRARFGPRVAALVEAETDRLYEADGRDVDWRTRKQEGLDRLARSPREVKMVALGDKLSNMRAIAQDYRQIGDRLWDRFHAPAGRADHVWRYKSLAAALSELKDTDAYQEFCTLIDEVFA